MAVYAKNKQFLSNFKYLKPIDPSWKKLVTFGMYPPRYISFILCILNYVPIYVPLQLLAIIALFLQEDPSLTKWCTYYTF
jgi:hypothetical protein